MFHARWHEQEIARLEGVLHRAVLENALPADDYVDFVLLVRLLRVVAHRRVDFERQGTVPEQFEERPAGLVAELCEGGGGSVVHTVELSCHHLKSITNVESTAGEGNL